MEYDSASVLDNLKNASKGCDWRISHLLAQLKECERGMDVSYSHIHREDNYVADGLAKQALKH